MKDIPQAWIQQYVDQLLETGAKLPEGRMRDTVLLRADHAMDLVEAFRGPQCNCQTPKKGDDPDCIVHGVAASNARQNEFFKRNPR